jgi:lincosamide nucleotidyltransferase A/C/D/E
VTQPAPPGGQPSARGVARRALHRFEKWVRSHRPLLALVRTLRRIVRATPLPPLLRRGWAWLHASNMRERDVLWILEALEGAGVPCVVGGGWGVDALVGHQTRRHHDLDLVLLEFDQDEPQARSALGLLGFRQVLHWHASTRWMPSRSVMDDGAGRCIDLVNLESAQVATMLGHRDPVGDLPADDGHSSLFVSGMVGGRLVVCLSAEAQLLLHTRFDLRTHHKRDANLLRHTLCATPASRPTLAPGVRDRSESHAEDGATTEPSRPSP